MRRSLALGVLSLVFVLAALPARAQAPNSPGTWNGGSSWTTPGLSTTPRGGLLPASLFDPSRFSINNSLVFGYSTGASAFGIQNGSAGLFTSSLGYKVNSSMKLSVDMGAHMNPAFDKSGLSSGVFLEGAKLDWHPSGNSLLRVEYRDYRSPLQNPWGGTGYNYDGLGGPYPFRN
jgi:hypothetical protein